MWSYTNFPVSPGDPILATQANELREALSRRASLVGATITLPPALPEVTPTPTYKSWVLTMRAGIEAVLSAAQYGRFKPREYIDPVWTDLSWEILTKASLLDIVHVEMAWVSNALVTDPADWMEIRHELEPPGTPDRRKTYAGHINELYYALEVLAAVELSASPAPYSTESKYAMSATWPDPFLAYEEGWDFFEAAAYAPSVADLTARADSNLQEWFPGQFGYSVGDVRVPRWELTVPALAYDASQLWCSWHSSCSDFYDPLLDMASHLGSDFLGPEPSATAGDVHFDEFTFAPSFTGWLGWKGLALNGVVQPFSHRWTNVNRYEFGFPGVHTHAEECSPTSQVICWLDFDGYNNGEAEQHDDVLYH